MRGNIFTCIFLFFMLTACQEEGVFYNKQVAIKDHVWTSSDAVSFDFNIQDTTKKYDLIFSLLTTDAYSWSNIYIFTELKAPDHPSPIKDTVEFYLADKYGNWLGENSGNTITNHFLLYKETQFPSKGDYTFSIQQAMRDFSLEEIMDVGLKVIESK